LNPEEKKIFLLPPRGKGKEKKFAMIFSKGRTLRKKEHIYFFMEERLLEKREKTMKSKEDVSLYNAVEKRKEAFFLGEKKKNGHSERKRSRLVISQQRKGEKKEKIPLLRCLPKEKGKRSTKGGVREKRGREESLPRRGRGREAGRQGVSDDEGEGLWLFRGRKGEKEKKEGKIKIAWHKKRREGS